MTTRETIARTLYEIQPVDDRLDPNGDPLSWELLASFCKELHYGQADAVLAAIGTSPSSDSPRGGEPVGWRNLLGCAHDHLNGLLFDLPSLSDRERCRQMMKRIRTALDATPPSPSAGREGLEQAKKSLAAALVGSCDCNTKTPDPSFHMAHCRMLKLLTALERVEDALSPSRTEGGQAEGGETDWYSKLPLAVRLRDEEGPPLPQMIAQQRAKQFLLTEDGEWNGPSYPRPSAPSRTAEEREALAAEIENFEEVILRTDDGPEWSDKRSLTDDEKDMLVAALRSSVAESKQNRTFDITGTVLSRRCNVFTITCDDADVAERVAGQLRTFVAKRTETWEPISTRPDTDDLMWFCRGNVTDGPRPSAYDDADHWDFWCYAVAPPLPLHGSR